MGFNSVFKGLSNHHPT